jgi:hypothetical protein
MSYSNPRKAEAINQTLTRMVAHYGQDHSVFITLTSKKQIPVPVLRSRIARFHRLTKSIFPCIFTVIGITPFARHVHCLAIIPEETDFKTLQRKIKQIKGKAGFSQVFSIERIISVPKLCRYIAKNYSDTAAYFALPPKKKVGQLWMYRGVPANLLVKASHFTRNTPAARKYRATLNRMASLAGTEIGDWDALERMVCERQDRIRRIVFGLLQRIPCGENGLSSEVLLTAFPHLRPFRSSDHIGSRDLSSICQEVGVTV